MASTKAIEAAKAVNSLLHLSSSDQESLLAVVEDYFTSPEPGYWLHIKKEKRKGVKPRPQNLFMHATFFTGAYHSIYCSFILTTKLLYY